MNIWTQEEYERFSKQIKKSAFKLAFDILFYTGIRSGELLALTPEDILPEKRLSINKNYAKIRGEELFLIPKTPKSKRTISIPDFLYDDIENYISNLYGIEPKERSFYFTKSALKVEINNATIKAGLKPIRVHDLRHYHASTMLSLNIPDKYAMEILGQNSPHMLKTIYQHTFSDEFIKVNCLLNDH